MILWGEEQREKDPGFFCRAAIEIFHGKAQIVTLKPTSLVLCAINIF